MKTGKLILAFCMATLAGCAATLPKTADVPYIEMDKFVGELATRANSKIGAADDFQIVVAQAYYPIGTLIRAGTTIPIDYTACLPLAADSPEKITAPNLFPVYTLSKSLAVDFGLDNEAIKSLADIGVTVKDKDDVLLTVKTPQIQAMADNPLKRLISRPDCQQSIPATAAWIVRGYILGQRAFTIKNDKSATFKGKIVKIASFNMSGDGAESLSLTDDSQVGFLQIVSQVTSTPLSRIPVSVTKPTVVSGTGRVYVQRDKQDVSGKAELVVASLRASSFKVENSVELIDTKRMPEVPQVRYFNKEDQPNAETAVLKLREIFPNAVVVQISLPAPTGQLEVWLPRVRI